MGPKTRRAKIAAQEAEAQALMATQAVAYAHGIDPNAWRAQRTASIMNGISTVVGDAVGAFTGKGPVKPGGSTPGTGAKPATSSNTVMYVGVAILAFFGLKAFKVI